MATISVEHQHTLGEEEAKNRVKELLQGAYDRLNVNVSWVGPNATFKGPGFSGTARVSANKIWLDLDLSLFLRPMKSKIEARVDKILKERFT